MLETGMKAPERPPTEEDAMTPPFFTASFSSARAAVVPWWEVTMLKANQKTKKLKYTAYTSNSFESVKPPIRMLVMPATTVALVLLPTPSAPLWVKNPKKHA